MRNLLYAIPRPGCIFRHAEKGVAKCTGINSSRLKFSPYGKRESAVSATGRKGLGGASTGREPSDSRNQGAEAYNQDKLFPGRSPLGRWCPPAGVALRGLDDLAAHGRAALAGSPAPRARSAWRLKISPWLNLPEQDSAFYKNRAPSSPRDT